VRRAAMPRLMGLLLLLVALTGSLLLAQEPAKEKELTKEERAKLEAEAKRLNEEGYKHYQAARFSDAEASYHRVLILQRKLYPQERFPNGHPQITETLVMLAFMLIAQNKHFEAES